MLRFRMPRRDNELQEKKCGHWGRKDRAFQYTRGSVRANGISDEGKLTPPRKEDQHMRTGPRSGKRAPDNDKRMDVLKESNRVAGEHRGHQRPPALSSDSTSTKPHVNVFTTRLGLWHLPGQNLLIITYCLQYFKGKRKKKLNYSSSPKFLIHDFKIPLWIPKFFHTYLVKKKKKNLIQTRIRIFMFFLGRHYSMSKY